MGICVASYIYHLLHHGVAGGEGYRAEEQRRAGKVARSQETLHALHGGE